MPQASRLLALTCALTCSTTSSGYRQRATTADWPSDHVTDLRPAAHAVLPGIDVLLRDSLHLVEGKRVGVLTNRAGIDAAGISTVERLRRQPGVRVVALFSPEHGIQEAAAPGAPVADSVDSATGIPIYSVYGTNRAPTPAELRRLDVLVVDLPDVGARPFTYISTTVLAMRAAAAANKRVIVLDRPDPIGCAVQGPVLDPRYASFIGMLAVPLRHGMTIGELARLANARLAIGADLVVVPVAGWRRCDWFDQTGLPWRAPSPNLPDLASVARYPGTVLFEATNLSVGRGTDAPFREVGAPWLDGARVARAAARRYGLRLLPVRFTPRRPGDGKYDGVALGGVRFPALDRAHGDPIRDALHLLLVLRRLYPTRLTVDSLGLARRLGRPFTGAVTWPDEVARFEAARRPYLLY